MKALTTGMKYEFIVTTEKADGSNKAMMISSVVALSIADAWQRIGAWAKHYMNSPVERKVTSIELQ